MLILAIDTSTEIASAALLSGNEIISEKSVFGLKTHSQLVMPLINELLSEHGIDIKDVDMYAVANGPGSFTGLRIGIAAAKAFAYVGNKPVYGINTLDALAMNGTLSMNVSINGALWMEEADEVKILVCPLIDARNDQVFTAFYKADGLAYPIRISDYKGLEVGQLPGEAENLCLPAAEGRRILFTGNAVSMHLERLKDLFAGKLINTESPDFAKAASVGYLAYKEMKAGKPGDWRQLNAFYLRESQAERLFKTKDGIKRNGIKKDGVKKDGVDWK